MTTDLEALRHRARVWLAEDPDPDTRAELDDLLARGDQAGLRAAFGAPLAFGTAGIRGPLGCGPARMNRLVARRVTAGLAARLALEGPPEEQVVVVGRDARHKSPELAGEVAAVLGAAGFLVQVFGEPVPTPVLAFAVRHQDAAAGVAITASHNPPDDNGYKVFWRGGAQIAPPLDAEIAAAIDMEAPCGPVPAAPGPQLVPAAVLADYRAACLAQPRHPEHRRLRVVHTALHGVAGRLVTELLDAAGFEDVHVVDSQHRPDPDFPTVAFPNPEEAGALDLALAQAREIGADLVLANDPDGDRIAAAVPGPAGWRALSGDELGCLLADYLLAEGPRDRRRLVATTVVSSQLLARIAAAHGAEHAETLTGFKWLARAMAEGEAAGLEPVLAYEQALGVMVGGAVRDKDGISAALVTADLVATLHAAGRTVDDALDDLARTHGVHATAGRSTRLDDVDVATAVVDRLLSAPPEEVAGVPVAAVVDHRAGVRRRAADGEEPLDTPPTELVGLELVDGSRVQVRPSGTEPVLKAYVEAVEAVADGDVAAARRRAEGRRDDLCAALDPLLTHPAP